MENIASEPPVSPAAAGEAGRWRPVAIPFALGLIVGGGIGCGALLLPAAAPGEAHAAAWQEATTAAPGTHAATRASGIRLDAPDGAASARAGRAGQSPPGSWSLAGALGGPLEPSPAPAVETRKLWWKMPGLDAASFALGSAR